MTQGRGERKGRAAVDRGKQRHPAFQDGAQRAVGRRDQSVERWTPALCDAVAHRAPVHTGAEGVPGAAEHHGSGVFVHASQSFIQLASIHKLSALDVLGESISTASTWPTRS